MAALLPAPWHRPTGTRLPEGGGRSRLRAPGAERLHRERRRAAVPGEGPWVPGAEELTAQETSSWTAGGWQLWPGGIGFTFAFRGALSTLCRQRCRQCLCLSVSIVDTPCESSPTINLCGKMDHGCAAAFVGSSCGHLLP